MFYVFFGTLLLAVLTLAFIFVNQVFEYIHVQREPVHHLLIVELVPLRLYLKLLLAFYWHLQENQQNLLLRLLHLLADHVPILVVSLHQLNQSLFILRSPTPRPHRLVFIALLLLYFLLQVHFVEVVGVVNARQVP